MVEFLLTCLLTLVRIFGWFLAVAQCTMYVYDAEGYLYAQLWVMFWALAYGGLWLSLHVRKHKFSFKQIVVRENLLRFFPYWGLPVYWALVIMLENRAYFFHHLG